MGFMKEFKDFAVKGNMIDMAVGIIIGAAFGKVVASLVGDVLMPPLGLLVGSVNFTDLALTLKEAAGDQPAVILKYGAFIQTIFDFIIIAFAIFMMVKWINKLKRQKEEAPAAPPAQEVLLREIRDILKQR